MTAQPKRLHNPALRLRRSQAGAEPARRVPADYPRGYIEQLARTFSDADRTVLGRASSRRPRPARGAGAPAGLS